MYIHTYIHACLYMLVYTYIRTYLHTYAHNNITLFLHLSNFYMYLCFYLDIISWVSYDLILLGEEDIAESVHRDIHRDIMQIETYHHHQ